MSYGSNNYGQGPRSGQGWGGGSGQGGWGAGAGGGGPPDANVLMQQIQQLQKTVMQLQTGGGAPPQGGFGNNQERGFGGAQGGFGAGYGGGANSGFGGFRRGGSQSREKEKSHMKKEGANESVPEEQNILLVSNIPPNLANPDSVFYMFEKFGTVERVKILHNKRNTALIQMSTAGEAQEAVKNQEKLNRAGTEIYVNFSSKFKEIRMPEPGSPMDDGFTRDYTGDFPGQRRGMADNRSMDMGGMTNMLSHMGGPGGNFGGGMSGFGGNNFNAGGGGGGPGTFGGGMGPDFGNGFHDGPFGGMGRGPPGPEGPGAGNNGVVLLISNLPDQVANLEAIFNMVGMYGDCVFIKILRNKRDCCLVQLAKPHHAQQVKNFLDQAKVSGNKICISYSRADNLNHRRVTEGDELQADYSYSKFHRYRNHQMAARLQRNLGPPTATLHVANLPEDMSHNEVKELFIERGFTVKDAVECGNGGMALLTMSSPDEALLALALMHNFCPEGYKTKNNNGLCVSFSANRGERRKNQE